jgi:hypothetical protein
MKKLLSFTLSLPLSLSIFILSLFSFLVTPAFAVTPLSMYNNALTFKYNIQKLGGNTSISQYPSVANGGYINGLGLSAKFMYYKIFNKIYFNDGFGSLSSSNFPENVSNMNFGYELGYLFSAAKHTQAYTGFIPYINIGYSQIGLSSNHFTNDFALIGVKIEKPVYPKIILEVSGAYGRMFKTHGSIFNNSSSAYSGSFGDKPIYNLKLKASYFITHHTYMSLSYKYANYEYSASSIPLIQNYTQKFSTGFISIGLSYLF